VLPFVLPGQNRSVGATGTLIADSIVVSTYSGVVALMFALCCATVASSGASRHDLATFSRPALDRRAAITAERSYTLNARVRLLLYWIRRENVGSARLTWRAARADHRIIEFLVGSDPTRAPRRINRWGFIAEEVGPQTADLLGIMTQSNEQSVDEADSNSAASGDRVVYRAIRTTVRNGLASSAVFRLSDKRPLTYRDLDAVLQWIPTDMPARREVPLPAGTRPGFLLAVEELITGTLDQCRAGSRQLPAPLPYVYNNIFYTLKLRKCDFEPERQIGGRVFSGVIRAELETKNSSTGHETPFRLVYGTEGDLKAVPVQIVFRPRWWFEAELLLGDRDISQTRAAAAGRY
jgi:hypothetical protein